MCPTEWNISFWSNLENEIHQTVPEIIKHILAATGFETSISLQNITSADILNIERFIDKCKPQWMQKYTKLYGSQSKKLAFKLLPGHSKILFEISEHYKRKATANEFAEVRKKRAEANVCCDNVSSSSYCSYSILYSYVN